MTSGAQMRRIRLHEIAHARAGDKGNTSNVSVWVYDPGDYGLVKAQLTAERVKAAYPSLLTGTVTCYALDQLQIEMQQHCVCSRSLWRRGKMYAFDSHAVANGLVLLAVQAVREYFNDMTASDHRLCNFVGITAKTMHGRGWVLAGKMKNSHFYHTMVGKRRLHDNTNSGKTIAEKFANRFPRCILFVNLSTILI